jgi:hypothetical protein
MDNDDHEFRTVINRAIADVDFISSWILLTDPDRILATITGRTYQMEHRVKNAS